MSGAAARWASSGIHLLLLPSGTWVKFKVPDAEDLLRRGLVPTDLKRMAVEFAGKGAAGIDALADEASEATITTALNLSSALVARGLRAVLAPEDAPAAGAAPDKDDPAWDPVAWSGGEFDEMELPGDDKATLRAVALRRMTARQATWLSRQDMGLVAPEQVPTMQAEIDAEAAATPKGWGTFRDQPGGGAGHGGGHGVGQGAERLPAPDGPVVAAAGGRGPAGDAGGAPR